MTTPLSSAATSVTAQSLQQIPTQNGKALSPAELSKIRDTAEQFEAMFMSEMMNHMNEGSQVDPMFGGGKGEEMFRSMLTQEYGKLSAKSHSGIGLADSIQKAMIDMQASANKLR